MRPARNPATEESPAPTELTTVPLAAGLWCTAPVSSTSTPPSPAMETRTLAAPSPWSLLAYGTTSSRVRSVTPKMSPSSWLLGFTRKGRYRRTRVSRSFSASTTMQTPRPSRRAMMRSYMSCGSVAGTEPEMTSVSPSPSASSLARRTSRSLSAIFGPMPLSSVSSADFTLTLMRVMPSATRMKSASTPASAQRRHSSSPVKPATNPSARLACPRLPSTMETFTPLPPGSTCS